MFRRVPHYPLVVSTLLAVFFAGCGRITSDIAAVENPPEGVVDDFAGFYLKHVKADNQPYFTHKGLTDFNAECKVEVGELSTCVIEGYEGDLFNQGLSYQFNVPSTMCTYVSFLPYYYFYREPGVGPSTVLIQTESTGAVLYYFNGVQVADAVCDYDYSPVEGPNCCEGRYSLTTRTWDAATATYVVATSPNQAWGGKYANCLAGPAMDTQAKSKSGFPKTEEIYVEGKGINKKYEIIAPIKKEKGSNLHVANFYNAADHASGRPLASTYPVSGIDLANPEHSVLCLDAAYEIKAGIKLLIRDWNYKADLDARDLTKVHRTGTEPSPFHNEDGLSDFNDFWSWHDYLDTYPGGGD